MKLIITTVNILFLISIPIFLSRDDLHKKWQQSETTEETQEIPGITHPQDLAATKDFLYILKENSVIKWDIKLRKIVSSEDVSPNSTLGLENNILYICSWENFEISSPDEFAAVISWRQYRRKEKELWLHKTIKPIKCLKDRIIAMNSLPTLQEGYYEISVNTGKITEVEFKDTFLQKSNPNITVDESGRIFITKVKKNSFIERVLLLVSSKN